MAKPPKSSTTAAPRDTRWNGEQFWYKAAIGEPVHDKLVPHASRMRALYANAHARDRVHERIYEGVELKKQRGALAALDKIGIGLAKLNAIESIVNTLVSRLSKDRAMPSVTPTDADWSLKLKAKEFRKFVVGEMMATDFDTLSVEALRDGAVIGNGLTRIDDTGDGDKIFTERVLREEWLHDPRECKYGKPPNGFLIRRLARDHLAEMYPASAGKIFSACAAVARGEDMDDSTALGSLDDYVDVYEAWHLPRGEDDGRHVICVDGDTLLAEQWHEPRFPVENFRFSKPMRGVWAKGLVWKLKDLQHRVNSIVRDIQLNLQATGRGHFLQQEGMALPPEMLTAAAPFVVKYKGSQPPMWTAPTPFSQAQLNSLQFFIQQMYDLTGVSQTSATSKSSLGAGASGVALDTQYDIDSERFATEQGNYAGYRMRSAQLYIDASKRVARRRAEQKKAGKKVSAYVTGWPGRDAIQRLDYDQVALETDQYRLAIEPTGFLPTTRAGKLSAVGQLAQAGIIPSWLTAALFDEPDLARGARYTLAAFWNCERKMEDCAYPNRTLPQPAAYNDLELELKMCTAYLNNAEAEKAPEEVCQRYRDYLDALKDLMAKKSAGMALPQMPALPAGQPGVVPAPGQAIPAMSGGALPPEMMPPVAA